MDSRKRAHLWLGLLSALAFTAPALGAEGIRGRAALAGEVDEGVEVRAYPHGSGTFGPLTGVAPAARARTGTDGTYELALPPGQYVVEGLKKAEGNSSPRPEERDLHCLYSGSPVTVSARAWTAVGLYLAAVPKEDRQKTPDGSSALKGRLTFKGKDVGKAYIYVYDDAKSGFRGPARLLQPVSSGSFRVRLPPGTYYLVARKRARGGTYGPIEPGDLFNFYARNPVTVRPGEEVNLEIPLIERLSQLEEDPLAYQGLRVRVVDPAGKAAAGYYVLAYPTDQRSGPPVATSLARTDAEGRTRVLLAPDQLAYLRARKSLGGPLELGELHADGSSSSEAGGEVTLKLRKAP